MKIIVTLRIEIIGIEHHVEDEVAEPTTTTQTSLSDELWDAYGQGREDEEEDKIFHPILEAASQRSDAGKHHRCSRCDTLGRRRLNGREGCHDCDGWDEATVLRFRTFADSRERWS